MWGAQLQALGNPCSCTELGNRTPYLRLPTPVSLNLFVFVLGYCESQRSLSVPHVKLLFPMATGRELGRASTVEGGWVLCTVVMISEGANKHRL